MKKLLAWIKPVLPVFLIICFFQMFIPLTYSYVPQFIKYIFDAVLHYSEGDESNTLPKFLLDFFGNFSGVKCAFVVGGALIIWQIIRACFFFTNGFLKGWFSESISKNMREKLHTHIQDLPTNYHNTVDTGDLIQRCTHDIDTSRGFLSNQLPEIFYIVGSFASGAVQMLKVDYRITLVTLVLIPLTLGSSIIYFKYISKKFTESEEAEAEMTSTVEQNVNGVRVVKAFNREIFEIEKFNKKSIEFKNKNFRLNKAMAVFWGLSDGIEFVQYAITISFCIYLGSKGEIGYGDMIAVMMYISMLIYPIRELGRIISDFGKASVASKRIDEILSMKDEYIINGTEKPEVKGNIEFNDVHFKFDDSDKELLKGISFNIKSGETVAIVGKTGSGKSTIASLLVRMAEYTSGSIKIDGVELKDIDKHHIRENVGIILQDPFLYAKTIEENIKIAKPELTTDDVYSAARTASVHDDILKFDAGYNTLVGEKGVTLSGGQKQRVAIARMIILNKPVMIFDDSLSAVDTKTDLQIRNALKDSNSLFTSIIITHRITTAKEADKIIVLEDGLVSAIGTHDELANKEGLYKKLWSIQGALEDEFINLVSKEVNE